MAGRRSSSSASRFTRRFWTEGHSHLLRLRYVNNREGERREGEREGEGEEVTEKGREGGYGVVGILIFLPVLYIFFSIFCFTVLHREEV